MRAYFTTMSNQGFCLVLVDDKNKLARSSLVSGVIHPLPLTAIKSVVLVPITSLSPANSAYLTPAHSLLLLSVSSLYAQPLAAATMQTPQLPPWDLYVKLQSPRIAAFKTALQRTNASSSTTTKSRGVTFEVFLQKVSQGIDATPRH